MLIHLRRCLLLCCAFLFVLSLSIAGFAAGTEAEASERGLTSLPEDWFDDAVFIGDSISVTLEKYCEMNGGLGGALFLCEFNFGIRNAVSGNVKL